MDTPGSYVWSPALVPSAGGGSGWEQVGRRACMRDGRLQPPSSSRSERLHCVNGGNAFQAGVRPKTVA